MEKDVLNSILTQKVILFWGTHCWFVIWGLPILAVFNIMKLNKEGGTIENVSESGGSSLIPETNCFLKCDLL